MSWRTLFYLHVKQGKVNSVKRKGEEATTQSAKCEYILHLKGSPGNEFLKLEIQAWKIHLK